MSTNDPHQGQPIRYTGVGLEHAKAVMIMLHGRGATAEDILTLTSEFNQSGFLYIAPQAAGYQWYPNRFMMPIATNEPYLSSALKLVDDNVNAVVAAGIPKTKIVLLGFSQGACLALEYVARNPQRYGGIAGLSGGLIGDVIREYHGSMDETPMFLGCSDKDMHIPKERVIESAAVFRGLGANVIDRLYPNMGHTVNEDELETVSRMMASVSQP
ncbi:MAG: alpha/beta hydrolase [Anaerolineae bacterium]|nr:alpha/beta hydrolase [Anaerolineae bacterium]